MSKQRVSLLIPDWPAPNHVLACSTLRGAIENSNEYSGFNLALHVNDAEENVISNRLQLKESLVLPSEPIWLEQVHGIDAVNLSEKINFFPKADASYSLQKETVCAVMTADCLPLLVTDVEGRGIASIHAGWRGLANGVIKNTLEQFINALSISYHECLVWLGPAISQKYFEVGHEVYTTIQSIIGSRLRGNDGVASAFIENAGERDKYFCDLYQLARLELQAIGVTKIYGGDQCTYEQEDRYFSYRRISHEGKENCGRMASIIWMV